MNNSNEIQPEGDLFTLSFECNFLLYCLFVIINWGILYFLLQYIDTYTYCVLGFLNAALMMVAFHEIIIHNERKRKQKQRISAFILTTAVVSRRYPDESSIFEEINSSEKSLSIPNNESPKKFDIVFLDPEDDHFRIYGLPSCIFCKHHKIYIGFNSNADPDDLFTLCKYAEPGSASIFNGKDFCFDAILKNSFQTGLLSNIIPICEIFEPELSEWNEKQAIKNGEYEIIGGYKKNGTRSDKTDTN